MEVKAVARFMRVPPRKARLVGELIKGKHVHDALAILKFTPNASARIIEKLVKSAVANAENNNHLDGNALKVLRVVIDQGPSLKRIQPRAMGRAYRILKRTSHIAVIVTEAEARVPHKQRHAEGQPKRGLFPRKKKTEPEAAKPTASKRKKKEETVEPVQQAYAEAVAGAPGVVEPTPANLPETQESPAEEKPKAGSEGGE